jgi:hypothetical protein
MGPSTLVHIEAIGGSYKLPLWLPSHHNNQEFILAPHAFKLAIILGLSTVETKREKYHKSVLYP